MQTFRFNIVTTDRGWHYKPLGGVATNHLTVKRHLTIDEFKKLIENGYSFANIVRHTYDLFEQAQTLSYDIDESTVTMNEYVDSLTIKPTICYTSPSFYDEEKQFYKFRLVYILDRPVDDLQTYKAMLSIVQDESGICKGIDCGKNTPVQFMNGNGTKTMQWGPDGDILHVSDFDHEKVQQYIQDEKRPQKRRSAAKTDFTLDDRFRETLTTSRKTFFHEYAYMTAPTCSQGNLHHSGKFYTHEDGYYTVRRKWEKDPLTGKKMVHRWKNGEQRRKKLFVTARILLYITPELTNEELVYNLALELRRYYDNTEDTITADELISIASNAMDSDWQPEPEKKEFTLNTGYVTDEPLTKQKRVATARRTLTDERIGDVYDTSLSPYENYKSMKEMGMKVSWNTVKRFARENGLTEDNFTGTVYSNNIIENKTPYILLDGTLSGKIEEYLKRGFKNFSDAWKTSQAEGIDLGMGRNALRDYCKQHHPELTRKYNKKQQH